MLSTTFTMVKCIYCDLWYGWKRLTLGASFHIYSIFKTFTNVFKPRGEFKDGIKRSVFMLMYA